MTPSGNEPLEENVLVCAECGRVNITMHGDTRSHAVRCSGCGSMLRGDNPRRISINCPSCQQKIEVDPNWLGHKIVCGACSHEFRAQRDGAAPLPAGPITSAATRASARVGQPDLDPEVTEEYDEQGRRRKVRRTRKKRKLKQRSWKEAIKSLCATLAAFGIVGGVITEVGRRSGWWLTKPEAVSEEKPEVSPDKPALAPAPVVEQGEMPALQRVVEQFCSTSGSDGYLGICRFPTELGERLRKYYVNNAQVPTPMKDIKLVGEHAEGQRLFIRFDGANAEGQPQTLVVERLKRGEFLADWDSHVRYAEIPWDDFVTKRGPEHRRFQLLVKRDFAGNPNFPVEEYSAFVAFWDLKGDGISLFAKRDSPEENALMSATTPQKKIPLVEPAECPSGYFPVTVEVSFPEKANSGRQPAALLLNKVFHDGWVDLRSGNE